MTRSNLQPLVKQAKENAVYYYKEFRKSIPSTSLDGYRSYCWSANYTLQWNVNTSMCYGDLGTIPYNTDYCKYYPYPSRVIPYMSEAYPGQRYESSLICLPNIFVAGFPKSGSSFFYHFIDNLISMSIKDWGRRQVEKEPAFWVHFFPNETRSMVPPKVEDLGGYLFNYVPGIQKISEFTKSDIPLLDGTPIISMDFPRFSKEENNLTNYCILPVVLPRLLPDSKYIFVMRNPIDMLYSGFWFSCARLESRLAKGLTRIGPDIFHMQTVTEIEKFNNCMRNKSEPSISEVCKMTNRYNYASCIGQRLHLLDKCSAKITHHVYSQAMPHCGEVRLYTGIYYVHLRKWAHLVEEYRMRFFTLEEIKMDIIQVAHDVVEFIDLDPNIVTMENIMNATSMNVKDSNEQTKINYKTDPSLKMKDDTRLLLEIFYHPFNILLAELLDDEKFKWF